MSRRGEDPAPGREGRTETLRSLAEAALPYDAADVVGRVSGTLAKPRFDLSRDLRTLPSGRAPNSLSRIHVPALAASGRPPAALTTSSTTHEHARNVVNNRGRGDLARTRAVPAIVPCFARSASEVITAVDAYALDRARAAPPMRRIDRGGVTGKQGGWHRHRGHRHRAPSQRATEAHSEPAAHALGSENG